jgi:hypothetical protein
VSLYPATEFVITATLVDMNDVQFSEKDEPTGKWTVRGKLDEYGIGFNFAQEHSYKKLSKAVEKFINVARLTKENPL